MAKGSNVHMKLYGYTWKDIDKSYWEGFDNAKNKMEKRIAELEKENAELEQQIEKMKCCGNCGLFWLKEKNETVTACSSCKDKNMWRLKE